jgi:hypothetical protein
MKPLSNLNKESNPILYIVWIQIKLVQAYPSNHQSLPIISRHKDICRSGSIDPRILDLDTSRR